MTIEAMCEALKTKQKKLIQGQAKEMMPSYLFVHIEIIVFDRPGLGRIGVHYFHAWCW